MTKKIRLVFPDCNYQCQFCHNEGQKDTLRMCQPPCYFDDIIDAALSYGYKNHLVFSGGEPLLYPEYLVDYMEHYKNKIEQFYINTNASLLMPSIVERFRKHRIRFRINLLP